MLKPNISAIRIDASGAKRVTDDRSVLRAAQSRIADPHWQRMLIATGKTEGQLLAALVRPSPVVV